MQNIKIALLLVFVGVFALQSLEIKGKVFLDANKNLQLDQEERGLAGVPVSNQREVVLTDQEGNYTLPLEPGMVVFVSKPSGYATPFDVNNLPQFYYIYQPQGSPQMKFAGIAPTGELPASVNFPLFAAAQPNEYEVVAYGDPQSATIEEIAFLRDDVISEIAAESQAAFCLVLGDVAYDRLVLYDKLNQAAACAGRPIYNVPGNHDLNHDVADSQYAYDTFKKTFGPHYYSFDYGQAHFVVLADIAWHPKQGSQKAHYTGLFGERQLEWLKNDLCHVDKQKLLVIGMHIPLKTRTSNHPGDKVADKQKLFELLAGREQVLLLAGHNHTIEHVFYGESDGWKGDGLLQQIICCAACGTWWGGYKDERGIPTTDQPDGTPNGYHILKIKGNQVEERFKAAFRSDSLQMRISSPQGKIASKNLGDTRIVVNVFDGSENFAVSCTLDERPAQTMELAFIPDPYFIKLHQENKANYREWVGPVPSTHLWQLPLPTDLKPGLHKIIVRAKNHYGKLFTGCQIFEVGD